MKAAFQGTVAQVFCWQMTTECHRHTAVQDASNSLYDIAHEVTLFSPIVLDEISRVFLTKTAKGQFV
jgi:hypothetical protein